MCDHRVVVRGKEVHDTNVVLYIPFSITHIYTLEGKTMWPMSVCVCVLTPAFAFLAAHLVYANGVYSCRAAGLNEKPLAGDQCYRSA